MNQTSPPTSRKALPSPLCPCTVAGTTLGLPTMAQALPFWSRVSVAKKAAPFTEVRIWLEASLQFVNFEADVLSQGHHL